MDGTVCKRCGEEKNPSVCRKTHLGRPTRTLCLCHFALPPCRLQGKRIHSSYSFLNLALDGVSGQRQAPAALYPRRKDPWYTLDRRMGGPQSWSGHRGQRKNLLPLPGIEPDISRSSSLSSDTTLTELPQLLN
jgi:hypothetical protein